MKVLARTATGPDPALTDAQGFLDRAYARLRAPGSEIRPLVRFGIDLGTATIVLAAVDAVGTPVYWDFVRAEVVRDGVVVDFEGAVQSVRKLKIRAETVLGMPIEAAATAHPPAIPANDARACIYVLRQADVECRALVDEVSAANAVLRVHDGAVVDVGGGSTGVGVYRDDRLLHMDDVPGGGHHLDLIVAGALHMSIEAAEEHKRSHGDQVRHILRPGVERVAESIRRLCGCANPGVVHLAGGALQLPGADAVVAQYLGWPVKGWKHAELITPFGIALTDGSPP